MNNENTIPMLIDDGGGEDPLDVMAKSAVKQGHYPDIDTAKKGILVELTAAISKLKKTARFAKLKHLIHDVTGDGSVEKKRNIPSACRMLVYSDKLGQPFFFDVFRYISFYPNVEIQGSESYRDLVEFVGYDLVECEDNIHTRDYIEDMPRFQKYVSRFLDQRTTPEEAKIAAFSAYQEYSDIYDEYKPPTAE